MIAGLLTALPPIGVIPSLSLYQGLNSKAQDTQAFDKIDMSAMTLEIARSLPKNSSQEGGGISTNPLLAHHVLLDAKFFLFAEIKRTVEFHDYSFDNDLRFNLPRCSYRQPFCEHTSAG
ncbi:hypothetical protein HUU05_15665 [candidate division KSB1 bacterium]|nr:hypothetical protein [candidate division KSB1 bacterium]